MYDSHGGGAALHEVGALPLVIDGAHGEGVDTGHVAVGITVVVIVASIARGPHKDGALAFTALIKHETPSVKTL